MTVSLVRQIDALLPQTQCGKCGYPGCMPYAEALAASQADINQCPPGGAHGIRQLAVLLKREFKPLSPVHGVEKPKEIARIDEQMCIGCTLCIKACPVDAIVGSGKKMHTVMIAHCTGCELCLPPCPIDCIVMLPLAAREQDGLSDEAQRQHAADEARCRFEHRNRRRLREQAEKAARFAVWHDARKKAAAITEPATAVPPAFPFSDEAKKSLVAAALARVRERQTDAARQENAQFNSARESG